MADFASLVIADAPVAERADELGLFGQFVGEWTVARRSRHRGGPWTDETRTWTFAWVLGGNAIADTQVDSGGTVLSLAVRTFDASASLWRVTWAGANGGAALLSGQAYGESGIRTEGTRASGLPIRANFSEIDADSFVWDEWVADDSDGPNWELEVHVEAKRVR